MAWLSPPQILALWDQVSGCNPCTQAVALVAALDGISEQSAAALPVGARDQRLFALHADIFGPRVECVADCPNCGELAEVSFDTSDFAGVPQKPGPMTLDFEGYQVVFRHPTSEDVLGVLRCDDVQQTVVRLLDTLIEARIPAGDVVPPDRLPQAVRDQVVRALAQAQPAADVELPLECASCGRRWDASFDIGSYLARALGREAEQLMDTVDVLASRYCWSEAEILALPARRRQHYLERALS